MSVVPFHCSFHPYHSCDSCHSNHSWHSCLPFHVFIILMIICCFLSFLSCPPFSSCLSFLSLISCFLPCIIRLLSCHFSHTGGPAQTSGFPHMDSLQEACRSWSAAAPQEVSTWWMLPRWKTRTVKISFSAISAEKAWSAPSTRVSMA